MGTLFSRSLQWLVQQWPYGVLFAIPFLLLLIPFWFAAFGLPLTLVYSQLAVYMIHQVEEHYHDGFRLFVNRQIGKGAELLTPTATFWINCLGVWLVDFVALYLAFYVDLSFGLIAIYLPLLNGIIHIARSIKQRCYNPGLLTAIFLFLPLGGWSLYVIHEAAHPNIIDQAIGLGIALLIHVLIIIHVAIRAKRLKKN